MGDYLEKQKELHKKAGEIISDLELEKKLSPYGKFNVVGSYELQLMSWEDIDIVVYSPISIQHFLDTVNYIFQKEGVYSIHIQDYRKSVHPNRPQGLYCGIKYLVKPETIWKIDIWFLPDTENAALETVKWVKPLLNDENIKIILEIKNEMREKIERGKEVSGIDVYKAVLQNNVKNLNQFREYLKSLRREL